MDREAGPVHYQQLLLWESYLDSEEEQEGETSEPLVPHPWRLQHFSGYKASSLLEAWSRILAALLLLAVGFSLAAWQFQASRGSVESLDSMGPPPTGHSHLPGVYHHSAIISPAEACSAMGRELLVAGGNVVDAGVGAALCLSVVHPHATGLGAMFWGLFHNSSSGNSTALTPGRAQLLAPGLGLPSALPALHLLHDRLGHLPWPRLLEGPTTLAQEGFLVDEPLAKALAAQGSKGLCPLLCHADGSPLGLGTRTTNPSLAAVLQRAALAPTPGLAGKALLSLMGSDLGLEGPSAEPAPTLEPALQLSLPQGILFTTPSPSAGPELLALLEEALHSGKPSLDSCPPLLLAAGAPGSSVLAAIDGRGSVLLLASSVNSSFGSRRLSPSTGVLLSDLVASSATSAWACPLLLHSNTDDAEADVLGLVASGAPKVARAVTSALLRHLEAPQTQSHQHHHQHHHQQGPTEVPSTCVQGTLLQVTSHAEHAHVSSVPPGCCPFQGV
ncbi:glutathione hydrolase 6 [Echinops telfairi]|uniref:Glutathione hydrolase 6 n=1 Tax=Echinops telfairi TaxID=9371 RepID=A0ABM0J6X2_ECHTE|nr:glutathione hydrolase 6 [Echinops telfairi]